MFFIASKIFWGLCAPSHIIAWFGIIAALLLAVGRRRAGTGFAIVTALLLFGLGIVPSYIWVGRPLEDRFPRAALPAHVDGILVLAGGWDEDMRRATTAQILARRYPDARMVFSGGSGSLLDNTPYVEAEQTKAFLIALGLDPARLTLEGRSRNTYENFAFTMPIAKPQPGEVWVLVTAGSHMSRAMEISNKMGWRFLPYPSSRLTPSHGLHDWFEVGTNLSDFDTFAREQIGLLAYRLAGRSSG